jgi:hypothetical protein
MTLLSFFGAPASAASALPSDTTKTTAKPPTSKRPRQSIKAAAQRQASLAKIGRNAATNAAVPHIGDGDEEADEAGVVDDHEETEEWCASALTRGVRVPLKPSSSGLVSYATSHIEVIAPVTAESEEEGYAIDPAWESQHARLPLIARLGWDVALAPTKLSEIVGQAAAKEDILTWWTAMKQGPTVPQAGLIMYGATGTGKTLMARLCAEHLGYTLLVPDADRGREAAHEALAALRKHSLVSDAKPIALFFEHVDDVDGKARECARIVLKAWAQEAPKAPRPRSVVLFSCESPYDASLVALRTACKLVAFPELSDGSMRKAITESCLRGGVKADADDIAKVLASSNGRMRAALLGLQFIACGSLSGHGHSAMKLDILNGPTDTARLALSTAPDTNIELASVHLEDAALALHSVLPASIPSMAPFKRGLEALTSSLDALGHFDLVQRTHWTEASAYFVGRGAAAPVRALRCEHVGAGSAPDMRNVWRGSCPEYKAQNARAARQLREARAQHEARIIKGCSVARSSDRSSRAYAVTLPDNICLLDQVRPSAATLEDLGILFPREWMRVSQNVDI